MNEPGRHSNEPKGHSHEGREATELRQSRAKAFGLRFLAGVIGLAGLVMLSNAQDLRGGEAAALGLAGMVLFGVAFWAATRAKRHSAPLAEDVLASDPRAPVLYLRSFETDTGMVNQEEALADIVHEVGPFIAIGRPGEVLPRLGAARQYVGDDEWQPYVRDMLDRSRMVFMLAGKTEGLGWEINEAFERLDPRRLVILVPEDAPAYKSFQKGAVARGMSLPDYPSKVESRHKAGGVIGLVHFDTQWDGSFRPFVNATFRGQSHQLAGAPKIRLKLALEPVYNALGIEWKKPRRNWTLIGLLSYFGLAVLVLLIFIWLGINGMLD